MNIVENISNRMTTDAQRLSSKTEGGIDSSTKEDLIIWNAFLTAFKRRDVGTNQDPGVFATKAYECYKKNVFDENKDPFTETHYKVQSIEFINNRLRHQICPSFMNFMLIMESVSKYSSCSAEDCYRNSLIRYKVKYGKDFIFHIHKNYVADGEDAKQLIDILNRMKIETDFSMIEDLMIWKAFSSASRKHEKYKDIKKHMYKSYQNYFIQERQNVAYKKDTFPCQLRPSEFIHWRFEHKIGPDVLNFAAILLDADRTKSEEERYSQSLTVYRLKYGEEFRFNLRKDYLEKRKRVKKFLPSNTSSTSDFFLSLLQLHSH